MEFTDFKEFENIISNIPEIDLTKLTKIKLKRKGIDVKIKEIPFNDQNGELIYILPNGKISKIAVHISEIKEQYKHSYKYHIFNCKTLQKMKYDDKEDRYKSNTRTDGTFFMIMTDRNNQISFRGYYALDICGYCRTEYRKKYNKDYTNLKEYYNLDLNNLDIWADIPSDMESAPQQYIKEWREIATNLKIKHNYICQKCGLNLKEYKKYLHAHHMDMNVRNNHSENIKILCIKCHGREPNHTHITSSQDWKDFMYLRDQGVITR